MKGIVPATVVLEKQGPPRATLGKPWFEERPEVSRIVGKAIFLLLICSYFGVSFACHRSFLYLPEYVAGLAVKPYQYRALPMLLFRALLSSHAFTNFGQHIGPFHGDPYRLVMAVIGGFGLLGALLANAATLTALTGDRIYSFWASMILAVMASIDLLPAFNSPSVTPYDVPSVMFASLLIYLTVRRGWWIYYPVYALAVFNRESVCFLAVFFIVWEWVRRQQEGQPLAKRLVSVAPHFVAQACLWIAIKIWLSIHFAHNRVELGAYAGGWYITHFEYNVLELLKPQQWPAIASICGFSLPFLWLQRRWIGCPPLAWAIAVVLPLSFAGLMIVGVIIEVRVFADWIALVSPALALIFRNRFRPVSRCPEGLPFV